MDQGDGSLDQYFEKRWVEEDSTMGRRGFDDGSKKIRPRRGVAWVAFK